MLVRIVYENNVARRYAEYQKMVDDLPETKVIMGIFNRPMRPVNRVYQYEATSPKKRKTLFEEVMRLDPDVIIVDGLRQKDLEFFFMDRGFDLIVGQRKEPGGVPTGISCFGCWRQTADSSVCLFDMGLIPALVNCLKKWVLGRYGWRCSLKGEGRC